MAQPASTGPTAADVPHRQTILLVGSEPRAAVDLVELHRCTQRSAPRIQGCATASAALQKLVDESFDCIILVHAGGPDEEGVDACSLANAIRASGNVDPILILTSSPNDTVWAATHAADAELYGAEWPWSSLLLLDFIDRTIERRRCTRESERRTVANSQRLDRERAECVAQLAEQRRLLTLVADQPLGELAQMLPGQLVQLYRELLRTYVMTAQVNLSREVVKFAQALALTQLTPRQIWRFHLEQVDALIQGLGQRSARHLLDRSHLLLTELLIHYTETLQQRDATTWWAWRRHPVNDTGPTLERRAA